MEMFWFAVLVAISSWIAGIMGGLAFVGRKATYVLAIGIAFAFIAGALLTRILQLAHSG